MDERYDQAVVAGQVIGEAKKEEEGGIIDHQYTKGIPGLLKALEALLSLIAYICVEVTAPGVTLYFATYGFFKFVSMTAFVTVLLLYILLLLKLQQRIFRCDCINWPFVEACYYAGVILCYFFGNLFLALHASGKGGYQAGCAFGFFAMGVFMVDGFFAGRKFWQGRQAARSGGSRQQQNDDIAGDFGGESRY